MKGAAIIYKTMYGSTEKYAKWLSESLKCDVFEMDAFNTERLKDYSTIIVMSGTYAGRMPLVDFLKKKWDLIKKKKLVVVAVGAAPENHLWSKISYFLIPNYVKKGIVKYFKLYGKYKDNGEDVKKSDLKRVIDYFKGAKL